LLLTGARVCLKRCVPIYRRCVVSITVQSSTYRAGTRARARRRTGSRAGRSTLTEGVLAHTQCAPHTRLVGTYD
jgi:hypothetical protein